MSSHKKKQKKGGSKPAQLGASFDYAALIPKSIEPANRELVKKFLCNELTSESDRDEALMIFAQALLAEQGGSITGTGDAGADPSSIQVPQKSDGTVPAPTSRQPLDNDAVIDAASVASPPQLSTSGESGGDFAPDADCFAEDRGRINVGWLAGPADALPSYDKSIAVYSQRLGCKLYNFISYPIGGSLRGFWKLKGPEDEPPAINLPDLQLQNHLWETYVNGQISSWIDCDSPEEWLSTLSEKELLKELNYACYLGLRSVVISLRHASSPRLASVLRKWLWTKNVNLAFWVFVPSSMSLLERNEGDPEDLWSVWADFRKACNNFTAQKLIAGLRLTTDLDDEFIDRRLLSRWRGEPLACFWVDADVFVSTDDSSSMVLPTGHANLLAELWLSDTARVVVRAPDDGNIPDASLSQMACAIRAAVRDVSRTQRRIADCGFLSDGAIDYMDVLQAPLQPLSDNLDSGVYNTFEQDPIKYKKYGEAVEKAIYDIAEAPARPAELVLYVLGAGRGPLVTASLLAGRNYNDRYRSRHDKLNLRVVVVEKNPNAVVTLKYCNERVWKNKCRIVESDMRDLAENLDDLGLPKPDILVSELLGSFGDNELSPECLDGVTSLLKPATISIPQSYTSYAAPIHSTNMYQSILSGGATHWNSGVTGHGRNGPVECEDGSWRQDYPQGQKASNLDQMYVVFLRSICLLGQPTSVFTFDHPNFDEKSNERTARISFQMDRTADLMGFAGYFHMTLYKDVVLSIEPSTHSPGMISWFPALIPLREMLRVKEGDTITFCIDRKKDEQGVWYEWHVEHDENGVVKTTAQQNKDGESYYMRLV